MLYKLCTKSGYLVEEFDSMQMAWISSEMKWKRCQGIENFWKELEIKLGEIYTRVSFLDLNSQVMTCTAIDYWVLNSKVKLKVLPQLCFNLECYDNMLVSR